MDVCPGIRISWDRGTHDVADAIHKSPLAPCQLYGGNGSERSYFLCNSIHFSKEKSDASKRGWIRWAHTSALDTVSEKLVQQSLDDVDVHLVAVSANCTVAVDIPMTVDEVIHIAVIPLAIQNHILKIEFSRF